MAAAILDTLVDKIMGGDIEPLLSYLEEKAVKPVERQAGSGVHRQEMGGASCAVPTVGDRHAW